MRKEQEVFDELTALCTSPGYIHAIANLSFRDCIVWFKDEMRAEHLQHMFSPDRLIRTELSTLIGLLIKQPIDYGCPQAKVVEEYIGRTEALLEELHRLIFQDMFSGLEPAEAIKSPEDLLSRGAALREPIFYSGESAYVFQYLDLAEAKYSVDNDWFVSQKGFSIGDARQIVDAIATLQIGKLQGMLTSIPPFPPTFLPGFSFTIEEVGAITGLDRQIIHKVVNAFSVSSDETNVDFRTLGDFNVTNAAPLLRGSNGEFILFQQFSIAEALYDSPFYWMVADDVYRDEALTHRGGFTEEYSRERLEAAFGKGNVYANVDIYETKAKRVGEIDVLVIFGGRAIVVQCKSKKMTLEARKGNDNQIKDDFKKSVQDSYWQGYECALMLGNPKLSFVTAKGEVNIPATLKSIYIFCIVSDHYPALSYQSRQFLKYQTNDSVKAPFVMDIFTLDVMAEMLASPLHFLSYVNRRTGYSDKLMASHELVILGYHLKKNLWLDEGIDFTAMDDSYMADLDVAMAVRHDNQPGKRTPDGILTRTAHTWVSGLIREIEAQQDSEILDLGLTLLALSENAVSRISEVVETTASKARHDGANHDVSFPLTEAGTGLTVHCNDNPVDSAFPSLQKHCTLRKYAAKTDVWYGICVRPANAALRFGVSIRNKWEKNDKMEAVLPRLREPKPLEEVLGQRRSTKVGRNDPCPCGSGVKYKKCCLR